MKNSQIIFISWTSYHSHTQLLGNALGANIFYINHLIISRRILWKLLFFVDYLYKSFKTLWIIFKNKPRIIVVQNPPSIAPIVVIFISLFVKYKTIVDSHNGAFEKPWVNLPFHRWALKHADIVIVHNNQIFAELRSIRNYKDVNIKKLGSKPSDFGKIKLQVQPTPYFLVISTFHGDEPMDILLEGIRKFQKKNIAKIKFRITGNYKKNLYLYSEYSKDENIEFLGFVNQDEYNKLLVNAFGTISLSTRDNVQQFSVIESISALIPFISSNNLTNRELFNSKMILTENDPIKISESIELFIEDRDNLLDNVNKIKKDLVEKWETEFNNIINELYY